MISTPGPLELMVILVIALIVLGPKRLPETARSLGKGLRDFKDALSGEHDQERDDEPEEVRGPEEVRREEPEG